MSGMALEQLAARPEQEGQDQAFGLGELERRLERRLGRAPVAEMIASRRVEQQRLDARPAFVQRRGRTADHRRQRLGRPFRVALCELQRSERDAHPGAVSLLRARTVERSSHGSRVAHPRPYLERPAAHVDREDVLAGEQPFQALRAGELAEGFVEAALAEAQHAAGVVEQHLGSRVGSLAQRFLRAIEMALGVGEAPHPHERHAGHHERAGRSGTSARRRSSSCGRRCAGPGGPPW